jgi:hypothetical protein
MGLDNDKSSLGKHFGGAYSCTSVGQVNVSKETAGDEEMVQNGEEGENGRHCCKGQRQDLNTCVDACSRY